MKLSSATRLLFSDPIVFKERLKQKIRGSGGSARTRKPDTLIKKSLEDRLEDVENAGLARLIVMGDQAFYESCRNLLGDRIHAWMNSDYEQVQNGATLPSRMEFDRFDGILIGGPQVKADYLLALRVLQDNKAVLPLLWVADDFEQCVGSVAFPEQLDDADVYLYNHFEEFFGLRDTLLVHVEIFDQQHCISELKLMAANESLHFNLKTALPERKGPAAITVHVTHPTLTRGRHFRWRFHADLYIEKSIVSLHGCHNLPTNRSGSLFRLINAGFGPGEFSVLLPNYSRNLPCGSTVQVTESGGTTREIQRAHETRIEELRIPLSRDDDGLDGFSEIYSECYGGDFWFGITRTGDGSNVNIAGNHTVGSTFGPQPEETSFADTPLYRHLGQDGFVLWPHAVPVTPTGDDVEFGFAFDEAWPEFKQLRLLYFDRDGCFLQERAYMNGHPGPVFTGDLPEMPTGTNLVIVAPCPESLRLSEPRKVKAVGNLVVRHRRTGDFDLTEFQSCWRNVGASVPGFPHWIAPPLSCLGRTNLYGRVTGSAAVRCGLVLVNGSGNLHHKVVANVELRLFDARGNIVCSRMDIAPFGQTLLWLDEVFPDFHSLLEPALCGALVIRCRNADLNAQMVTIYKNHGVSLQHLWGY